MAREVERPRRCAVSGFALADAGACRWCADNADLVTPGLYRLVRHEQRFPGTYSEYTRRSKFIVPFLF